MKKTLLVPAMLLVFCSMAAAQPASIAPKIQHNAWGFGLILGEPWAGWTMKYWLNKGNAIDAAIGVDHGLHLHGDFLWHSTLFAISAGEMPLYYGAGIMAQTGGGWEPGFGPRGVVGFDWLLPGAPLDLFLETAPTINFFDPRLEDFFLTFALGIRFYL